MNRRRIDSQLSLVARSIHSDISAGSRYMGYFVDDDDDDDDDDDLYDDDDTDQDYYDLFNLSGSYVDMYDWDTYKRKKDRNAISWAIKSEAYCFDIPKFSEKLVDATIIEVKKSLKKKQKLPPDGSPLPGDEVADQTYTQTADEQKYPFSYGAPASDLSFFQINNIWPRISEFNIKLGLEKLEYYVSTWKRSYDWMFCVEFLGFECEDSSNIFVYEVEWSKPSAEYPIPQTTASVYFALEVFKIVPYNHDRNVEVTYIFEASNVIHYPGRIDFQEKWLDDIIQAKLKFFKSFTFSVGILSISLVSFINLTLFLKASFISI